MREIISEISGGLLTTMGMIVIFITLTTQKRFERLLNVIDDLVKKLNSVKDMSQDDIYGYFDEYKRIYTESNSLNKYIRILLYLAVFYLFVVWLLIPVTSSGNKYELGFLYFVAFMGWGIVTGISLLIGWLTKEDFGPFFNNYLPKPEKLISYDFLVNEKKVKVEKLFSIFYLKLTLGKAKNGLLNIWIRQELFVDGMPYSFTIKNELNQLLYYGYGRARAQLAHNSTEDKTKVSFDGADVHLATIDLKILKWDKIHTKVFIPVKSNSKYFEIDTTYHKKDLESLLFNKISSGTIDKTVPLGAKRLIPIKLDKEEKLLEGIEAVKIEEINDTKSYFVNAITKETLFSLGTRIGFNSENPWLFD